MNRRNDMIVEWAVNRIKKEFKEDVSLLLTYGSYENGTYNPLSDVDFYFIPKTKRAYELCKTFIVEGIGFDLFPMSWERVERIAEFKEVITPCLANVKILYCNSDEDKNRFENLQSRLKGNLRNKKFMLEKASEKLVEAMDLYKNMLFDGDICNLKTVAGFIAMSLSDAVAYSNQTYFSRGLKKQIEDLKNMGNTPIEFVFTYESIIKADSTEQLMNECHKMIKNTKDFLDNEVRKIEKDKKEVNYKELAELYQEIISTWNKIYVCCDNGDAVLAYISGTCLQDVLNSVSDENDLKRFNLMGVYNSKNLLSFKQRAIEIQREFVKLIESNGVIIEEYSTVDEFIEKN